MSKMKQILGILLAVCFLLSVTAASASANAVDGKMKYTQKDIVKESKSPKLDSGKNVHNWKNQLYAWVWVPKHCEKKEIKTVKIVKEHGKLKRVVIKKVINIIIPGHWELKIFKFNELFKMR